MIAQCPFRIAETVLQHQFSVHFHSPEQSFLFLYEEKICILQNNSPNDCLCVFSAKVLTSGVLLTRFL